MNITIHPNDDIFLGIKVDCAFDIRIDGKLAGYGGVSETDNEGEIYLEYVELYIPFKGRHLYRDVLLTIAEYFHANVFVLESSVENRSIYEHFGAEEVYPPDYVREMWSYRLPTERLQEAERTEKE